MPKVETPESSRGVFTVMRRYCNDKKYYVADRDLEFMAEACFLYYEGTGWKNVKYWPAVAMKWVLNEVRRGYKPSTPLPKAPAPKPDIDTSREHRQNLRDQIRKMTDGQEHPPCEPTN